MKEYKTLRVEHRAHQAFLGARIKLVGEKKRMFTLSEALFVLSDEYLNKE